MTQNIISVNNNMNVEQEIKALIDADKSLRGIQSYHPKILKQGGDYTSKALAFNRKMIREGKTNKYLEQDKFYNLDTDRVFAKPLTPVRQRIRKKFKNDYNIDGQVVSRKKTTINLDYVYSLPVADQSGDMGFGYITFQNNLGENNLNNPELMKLQMTNNNIIGKWRVLLLIDGVVFADEQINVSTPDQWFADFGNIPPWRVNSDYMIYNYPPNGILPESEVKFIYTKENKLTQNYFEQTYADSAVATCLLKPIYDWAVQKLDDAKGKATKERYTKILAKFNGVKSKDKKKRTPDKIGYFEKYRKGVKESEIIHICEDCQIGLEIDQPFADTLLYSHRPVKKPLKVFKFLNSRLNHVEINNKNHKFDVNSIFKRYDTEYVQDRLMIRDLANECDLKQIPYTYNKNGYGISALYTLDRNIKIYSEYNETVQNMEKWIDEKGNGNEAVLKFCSFDAKQNPLLYNFISLGTHFNGCVDFIETSQWKNLEEPMLHIPKQVKHIDMTKAYTQFRKCKWYDGFALRLPHFRKCSKIMGNGLYAVVDMNLDNCSDKFRGLIEHIGWFNGNNVYTKEELEALSEYGGTYKVVYGAYGLREEFVFSEEMINKKEIIKFNDNEIKIPFYSKWCGMNCHVSAEKSFYMKGEREFFENINTNEADIYYNDFKEARISYPNTYQYNKKHITAQITAYQRLIMLEQLMRMDSDKLIRICTDGIYYWDHDFEILDVFSKKEKMTFNNDPANNYLSNLIDPSDAMYHDDFGDNDPRGLFKSEIHDSAGGDGKTHTELFLDKGWNNICYVAHSNELTSDKAKEYFEHCGKKLNTSNHHRLLNNPFSLGTDGSDAECHKYWVYLIDECSMLTDEQKQYMLDHIKGVVIFLGDTACQCLPIGKDEKGKALKPMNHKNIDYVHPPSKKNYRFKDSAQLEICNKMRKYIKGSGWNKPVLKNYYQTIYRHEVINHYSKNDMILVSRHVFNDEWNETLKHIEKYRVKNNTRDYKNGNIIYEEIPKVETEFRHGFTIHSCQGKTFKNKIFIDMRKMNDERVIYTAISRAEYSSQIYLVI